MSAAFTPGPWQAKGDYTVADATTIIANVDGESFTDGSTTHTYEFIATCENEYGERSERAQANARLIIATPDLYKGCNALLGLLQLLLNRDDLPDEVRDALTTGHRIDEAKAAVAKASQAETGEDDYCRFCNRETDQSHKESCPARELEGEYVEGGI